MSRADKFVLIISVIAVFAGFFVHDRIFERMAHIEDEMAYVWQAQLLSRAHLTIQSPVEPKSFLVPFVVDYRGQRFGKYPLGWPILLAVGERLGLRHLVNPLLAGLAVWLTYLLGKRVFGVTAALLAAGLTLTSPFFLMNSGSLLSHPLGLVLSTAFAIAWIDAFCTPKATKKWRSAILAALWLGILALTRPMTALAVAVPFGLFGIFLFLFGDREQRRRLILFSLILLLMTSLHFVWQYAFTGDPLLNPYTLWWEYDKVGFGPGVGRKTEGHSIHQAWINTRQSLRMGLFDLFGWWSFSWIFMPFGLLALLRDRNWRGLLVISVFPCLVILYLAYWIGATLFGPRYFYEGLFSLTLLSGVGIAFLAGWPTKPGIDWKHYDGWRRARSLAVVALIALLVSFNLLFYAPVRLKGMHGLYGVERAHIEPFLHPKAQEYSPALVIVHPAKKWIEYGTLIELQNPFLDTPFVFVISRSAEVNANVADSFPDRHIYHYYQNEPYTLYTAPRQKK